MGKRIKKPKAMEQPTLSEIVRFLKFGKKSKKGCWGWKGYKDKDGYGQFWWRGRVVWIHRFSFAAFKGPIPAGLDIHHIKPLCKKNDCWNPTHLRTLSKKDNGRDGGLRRFRGDSNGLDSNELKEEISF